MCTFIVVIGCLAHVLQSLHDFHYSVQDLMSKQNKINYWSETLITQKVVVPIKINKMYEAYLLYSVDLCIYIISNGATNIEIRTNV